ncbi:MAG TPA: hypothetical protein VMW09_03495 [Desulfatiglandales bacterium]|nr:hypothetical protein [Desulfatiglandales bacterium]
MANRMLMTTEQRELLKLFSRVAEAAGGIDLKCRIADAFVENPLDCARILNDKIDEQREKGVDLSIKSGEEISNLSFKDIDDQDFLRSFQTPSVNFQNKSGDQHTVKLKEIEDDDFFESLKNVH